MKRHGTARPRQFSIRSLGWLAVLAMVASTLLPTSVLANDLNQSLPISSNSTQFPCDGDSVASGKVLWHFVQTNIPEGTTTGELTATFDNAGPVKVASTRLTGSTLHWYITTDAPDPLLSASSNEACSR